MMVKKILVFAGLALLLLAGLVVVTLNSQHSADGQPTESSSSQGQSQDGFGLTKEQRQQVYKDLYSAEYRANNEAEARYPTTLDKNKGVDASTSLANVPKQTQLTNQLIVKYHQEVLDRYSISEDVATQISAEGLSNQWPQK